MVMGMFRGGVQNKQAWATTWIDQTGSTSNGPLGAGILSWLLCAMSSMDHSNDGTHGESQVLEQDWPRNIRIKHKN